MGQGSAAGADAAMPEQKRQSAIKRVVNDCLVMSYKGPIREVLGNMTDHPSEKFQTHPKSTYYNYHESTC